MATPRVTSRKESSRRTTPAPEGTGRSASVADRIRCRAYELFEARQRSGLQGDPTSDWLQAEREIQLGKRSSR